MSSIFHTLLYQPLYNILIFLVGVVPGGDLGIAIIILTLLVKFAIFPLSHKSVKTQAAMRRIDPDLKTIREKKLDKQTEAMQIMELYKQHGINPFSGCFLLLVQLPIILALYWVFVKGLPLVNDGTLYSFIPFPGPDAVNTNFLGLFPLEAKSIFFAILAGVTQYIQISLSLPSTPKEEPKKQETPTFQQEFSRNMSTQMKYVMPVVITFVAYSLSAAIALYWIVNNLFSIGHELYVRKTAQKFSIYKKV